MHSTQLPDKLADLAAQVDSMRAKPGSRKCALSNISRRNAAIASALTDGHGAAEIALRLGLAENTVREIGRNASVKPRARVVPPAPMTTLRGAVSFDQAGPMALAVLAAKPGACRWPMEDGEAFTFCGARAVASKSGGLTLRSFCAKHAGLAYRGQARIVSSVMEAA